MVRKRANGDATNLAFRHDCVLQTCIFIGGELVACLKNSCVQHDSLVGLSLRLLMTLDDAPLIL